MEHINFSGNTFEKFARNLLKEIDEYKVQFQDMGLDIKNYLPAVFTGKDVGVHIIYSNKSQNVLFRFDIREKRHVILSQVDGELFDLFDRFDSWKDNQAAFRLQDFSGAFVGNRVLSGRPIIIEGENVELAIEEFRFNAPYYGQIHFPYAFVFSFKNFDKINSDLRGFISRFLSVIEEFKNQKTEAGLHYQYLEGLKRNMEVLFFDEKVPELKIDRFIEMNPVVLELGLHITKPRSQVVLKNVTGKHNNHDFRPDLIAYDNRARNWTIVDYKKAKRTVIKNAGDVRTGFRAEVYALKDQLRNYVRYFQEREHRIEFQKKYGFEIKRPRAIGIIGNVGFQEREDFEDLLMEEFNQQYNIIPYNYLYENFCESIDFAFKYIKTR